MKTKCIMNIYVEATGLIVRNSIAISEQMDDKTKSYCNTIYNYYLFENKWLF